MDTFFPNTSVFLSKEMRQTRPLTFILISSLVEARLARARYTLYSDQREGGREGGREGKEKGKRKERR